MTSIDPLLLLDNTSMMSVMNKGVFRCTDVTFEEAKAIMEVHQQEDILQCFSNLDLEDVIYDYLRIEKREFTHKRVRDMRVGQDGLVFKLYTTKSETQPVIVTDKGNEAKKEFNTALSLLNSTDLHSLADVDKKFNLKTTEIVVIKSGGNTRYNLLQKDGSNIILRNDLFDLKTYKSYEGNFEDNLVYHKVETPKAMVGKWKNVTEGNNTTVQISDHGIISDKYYDNKAYAFYSLADQEKYDGDTTSKEEIEHTFEVIQEAVKSEGYQVKSAKEVYIQANSNYCFVPVNGGKNILVLRGGNEFAAKLEKVK